MTPDDLLKAVAQILRQNEAMKDVLRLVDSEEDFYINGPLSRHIDALLADEDVGPIPKDADNRIRE